MINVRIVTPNGLYKETTASIVNVVSLDGERGILPNHMPIVVSLKISKMELAEEKREVYAIAGGMLYFKDNECTILTPAIENKEDIDLRRAEEAKERAEKRIHDPNMDQKRAEVALRKAMNRISVKGY
ncbi:MAG: ATP synthase F1 subunit epsilon [Erysipelotrichaceae bacterium]|nr:ATP synthase F1 subunit epsilon [Bacillota bacterium]MDY3091326.1 ATP synthase F1 subunit epsilon [Erysipelotrichaceae bacterium]